MVLKYAIFLIAIASIKSEVIVQTTSGYLKGTQTYTSLFSSYIAFRGIPYAEPPVGNLRFRAPVPYKGWPNVRDASSYGSKCITTGVIGFLSGGDEDCLFLNVYTKNVNGSYPVLVFIYGGALIMGDGSSFLYGPDFLLKEDIVVVTFNYRLGAFGFLSTNDQHAQGNYGLKDALLALQWIKKNIKYFGGDDSKITLAGQSAGAVLTHHLMISPKTEDLFHQAIMMSGNVFLPFSFQKNSMKKTEALAMNLGIKYNTTADLIEKLRAEKAENIIKYTRGMENQDLPFGNRPFDFVLTVEPKDSLDERLITDDPETLMLNGSYRSIPVMIGTTDNEGLLTLQKRLIDPTMLDDFNKHPDYFVPLSYNLNASDLAQVTEVANTMRKIYFEDKPLTDEMKDKFAVFNTDTMFKFPTDRVLKMFSQNQNMTIYNYEFSYSGAYNMVKFFLFLKSYSGACHGDDLFYIFRPKFPMLAWPWDHASTVRKRMLRMWGNFIKTGNPTPHVDELVEVQWSKYTSQDEYYLEIGHDLTMKAHHDNLRVWHEFQRKFTHHL